METAKPIDLEPEVPTEVTGRCCYFDKCVWGAKIVPSKVAAVELYRDLLSTAVLSSYEPVENPQKLALELWRWVKRYVSMRLRLHKPEG